MADATTLALRAILKDEISAGLKGVQTGIVQTGDAAKAASSDGFGSLQKILGDVAGRIPGVSDGMSMASKAMSLIKNPAVEAGLAIGAATAAMVKFTFSNEANVIALSHMSAQTGISINALAALKKAGAESDISLESLAGAVGKLEKNIGTNGVALKKMGVDSHDPIEAMAQVADKFKAAKDPIERATIGTTAFGRSWQELAPMLDRGGDAIRKANSASSISPEMVARYEQMHTNQLAITASANAWKKLLGDIGSTFLAPIISGMAEIAGYALKAANYMKDALGYSSKAKVQSLIDDAGSAGEQAGNRNIKRSSNKLDFKSHYNDEAAKKGADDRLLSRFKTMSATETSDYSKLLNGWSAAELDRRHITQDTIKKLYSQYNKPIENKTARGPKKEDPTAGIIAQQRKTLAEEKAYQDELDALTNAGIDIRIATISAESEKERMAIESKYADLIKKAGKNKKNREALKANEAAEIENLEKTSGDKIREVYQQQAIEQLKVAGELAKDKKKIYEDGAKAVEEVQKQAAAAQADGLEGQAALDAQKKAIAQEKALRDKDLRDKIKDDKQLQDALVASNQLAASKMAKVNKQELDERKKEYEKYSQKVQSLAQGQLESALKGEFTLKSAKEAVKNAAIQFIAEEATSRIAKYVESLIFEKATGASAAAESIAQAEVTGTAIASAMASAAALQSIATLGAADVAGAAGLTSTITLAQGYAMAANGTDFAPGGSTIVGERGPELVNLPRGSEVIPNHALQAWTGSNSSSSTVNNNTYVIKESVDPRQLSKAISRATSYQKVSRGRGSV